MKGLVGMYYEINVSLNGVHFFATSERSIREYSKLEKIHSKFVEKFPEEEGYKISVTKWEKTGYPVEI
jgi:hypothetical protein